MPVGIPEAVARKLQPDGPSARAVAGLIGLLHSLKQGDDFAVQRLRATGLRTGAGQDGGCAADNHPPPSHEQRSPPESTNSCMPAANRGRRFAWRS